MSGPCSPWSCVLFECRQVCSYLRPAFKECYCFARDHLSSVERTWAFQNWVSEGTVTRDVDFGGKPAVSNGVVAFFGGRFLVFFVSYFFSDLIYSLHPVSSCLGTDVVGSCSDVLECTAWEWPLFCFVAKVLYKYTLRLVLILDWNW